MDILWSYSGEISKHGRALKHLVIDDKKGRSSNVIFIIWHVTKEYGSVKDSKNTEQS